MPVEAWGWRGWLAEHTFPVALGLFGIVVALATFPNVRFRATDELDDVAAEQGNQADDTKDQA